jgi:WD40 repeat protein
MNWPTSQDYNEAVQDPASFTDPSLKGGEVVLNALGLPVPRSGNFADVYQFKGGDGKMWALKCFTRKVPGLRERYAKIDEHLNKAKLPFAVGFKFFQEGIQVKGEKFPLLKMEWVEGFTLNEFVAQNLAKPHYLHALMQMWTKLTARLRDANIAHADLQHGNVLLVPGATPQKLGLKLIDYDGMWVPALSEFHSGEVGHPNFQHPLRLKEKLYNGDVDRFPHLVIAAGLRATLIGGEPIWERFDNEDNLLFKEADLRDPANSKVFKALWELNDPVLRTLVGHLALSSKQPLRKTPWLDDVLLEVGGPKLTSEQENQVCSLLGVSPPTAAAVVAPARVEQEFNVFQFFDDDEPTGPADSKTGRRPPPVKRPQSRSAKKNSKAPLFIAGGVAAAVLVVGGIVAAIALAGNKKQPTNEVVQNKEGDGTRPPDHIPGKPKADPKERLLPGDGNKAKDELRLALTNTRWNWGDAILELKADGKTHHPIWEDRFHLTTRWEAIDRRTALLYIESGRKLNMYSVLEFSEDLAQFAGFDFGATNRFIPKKRVSPLAKPAVEVGPAPPDTKDDLHQRLAGSRWEWERGKPLVLQEDGYADLPRIDGQPELLVKWEAIDRRTVMLIVEQGRNVDRFAYLQFSEDLNEFTGFNFSNVERLIEHIRLDKGGPLASPKSGAIGVAADHRGGRDYLFIRKDDPTLYMTQNGSPRKAREVGRHPSPIRVVAVTPDGEKAITGSDDGEVRIWTLSQVGKAPPGAPGVEKKPLAEFKKITSLGGNYSIDVFDNRIVVHELDGKDSVSMSIGKPGFPVKGAFASNLKSNAGLADRLGQAVTNEVPLFKGELIAQVFEGGVQLFGKTTNKSWYAWHRKRTPLGEEAPATSPENRTRADYLWIDDELPAGAKPPMPAFPGDMPWEFVTKSAAPVHSGEKSIKLAAMGYQQHVARYATSTLRVGKDDILFAYVYIDPKNLPEEIMVQWHSSGWGHRAYWGDDKIRLGNQERKAMGAIPEAGKWVRLEMKIADVLFEPGAVIDGIAVTQFGGTAYWDTIGINTQTSQSPMKELQKRADFVWLDDALPAGAKQWFERNELRWEFIGKKDGPVHSGEKAVKLSTTSLKQNVCDHANPGLHVGAGDVLFAHVYLDPKSPPEEIMLQWQSTNWRRAYWGPNKINWGRDNSAERKAMGPLPETGKWVRLEMKAMDLDLQPGAVIDGLALVQLGGTAYWDTIGINTATSQGKDSPITDGKDAAAGGTKSQILKGHAAPVAACAVSHNGKHAATIGKDNLLCLWDLDEAKLVLKFNVPEARAVAFLPDDKNVVIGTESESAGVWDLEKKERIKELPGHQVAVRAVCASKESKKIWTGDEGGQIRSWKLPSYEYAGLLFCDKEPVSFLAISPDDKTLACAGTNGSVRFFDPTTGASVGHHQSKTANLSLAFINDGKDLIAAREPEPLIIHLTRPGTPPSSLSKVFTLLHETEPILEGGGRIGFSPDGKYFFNAMKEAVMVLEAATGKEVGRCNTGVQYREVTLGPNKHLYFSSADNKFQLWDWSTGEMLKEVDLRASMQPGVFKINLTADPNRLLLLTLSPTVLSWDVTGWKVAERFNPFGRDACIRSAMFPDGTQAVLQSTNPGGAKFVVWDLAKGEGSIALETVETNISLALDVSPNGKWIVGLGAQDGKNPVWDAKTGKLSPMVSLQGKGLRGGFTVDGEHFVRCELSGQRALVDLQKDIAIEPFQPRLHPNGVVVCSATNTMATVDADRRIRFWRIEVDGQATAVVPKTDPKTSPMTEIPKDKVGFLKDSAPLSDTIVGCTFSTDGKKIYVSTQDGEVHVLDPAILEEKSKFTASKVRISHMAFVPKTSIATGGLSPERVYLLDDAKQVHVWDPEKAAKVKDIALEKALAKVESVDLFAVTATDTFLFAFDRDRVNSAAWDLRRGAPAVPPILNRPIFAGFTRTVAFTPDGRVGAAQAQGKLLVWNVGPGTDIRILDVQFPSKWLGLAPDASVVAMATDNRLQLWNYSTGKEVKNLDAPHGRFETFVVATALKGQIVVTAGSDRTLRAWDAKTGGEVGKWQMEQKPDGVTLSQDGKFAAIWHGGSNKVSLWAIGPTIKDK